MAEVRVSHFLVVAVIVGALGFVILTFFGVVGGIGWLTTKNLKGVVDKGLAAGQGYTPAKTPAEAMDNFRRAVQDRDYKNAARYVTKSYADMLDRAHEDASKLAKMIDKIDNYGKSKGFGTDKTAWAFHHLDPLPKDFSVTEAPVMRGNDKAVGKFTWVYPTLKTPNLPSDPQIQTLESRMFSNVLFPQQRVNPVIPVEVIKEGEEWKLNIQTTQIWETEVSYFREKVKTYQSNLDNFEGWMLNNRFDSKTFESEILDALKKARM